MARYVPKGQSGPLHNHDLDYDPIGEAASEVSAHEGKSDPHGFAAIATVISGAVGDGSTDDSTVFIDAINAVADAGGGVVRPMPGSTYVVEGLPLREGVWLDLRGVKLTLPATPASPMFVAGAVSSFEDAGIVGGELDGVDSSQHGIDFSAATRLDHWVLQDCYVHHFDRGYNGSQNDRNPIFRGNRIWHCTVGAYVHTNHPIFGMNDFRHCGTGVGGDVYDGQFTGTKFVRNDYGVRGMDGGTITKTQYTGLLVFRNVKAGLAMDGFCLLTGSRLVPDGSDAAEYGVTVSDNENIINGNGFDPEAGTTFGGAAILVDLTSSNINRLTVSSNNIAGVGQAFAFLEGSSVANVSIFGNTILVNDNNPVLAAPASPADAFSHGSITNNNIRFTGDIGTDAVVHIPASHWGNVIVGNYLRSSGGTAGAALRVDARSSIVSHNRCIGHTIDVVDSDANTISDRNIES